MEENKKLIIIDSNSLIHRAYHALPHLTTKSGQEVGAIYGFLLMFFKIIKAFKPDFLVATFDLPVPTFRHEKFEFYKAKRPKIDVELASQIPKIKEILKLFNVPIFEKEGFEADDLIGTISKSALKEENFFPLEIIILSNDFDTLQLVDDRTKVYSFKKGAKEEIFYDQKSIKEKYQGLSPSQLIDFKALKGDPSDNIAGVKGIGEKSALFLIKEFNDLENLYRAVEENNGKTLRLKERTKEILMRSKKDAFFSKELIKIKRDVPIEFRLAACQFGNYNKEKIIDNFKGFEFNSLIKKISEIE